MRLSTGPIPNETANRKPEAGKFTLDVDTLGKPGEIVVVPSRRSRMLNRNRNRNRDEDPENASGDTISAMLNELDDEKSLPSDQ